MDEQSYLKFLLEVLKVTAESEGNTQVVYPLLAAHTDKLNLNFAKLLQDWAKNILAEAETAQSIAIDIGNFSNLIQQFPLGNKANNMEIAITGYEIALTVFTRHTSPELWGTLQNNLGNAYSDRIRGDKADNLEMAIAAFSAALEVRTRNDFPVDWATTQNNLGTAYSDRIRGDKADNLEMAIAAYTLALEVYTRTDFPVDWAMTQNNLATAYSDRIRGDKAENLENAIAAYTQALEVRTRTDFPVQWATTQNNLATAYSDRIRGDKADNLEMAIAAYTQALEVYTRTDFPVQWATTQNNLGNAYSDRIRGDKADNLEMAIAAYTQALEVRTRTDFPVQWATTQNNLGNAYSDRIRGDKADNLEMAIAAYTQALEVYTRTDFPEKWAITQNNLGNAYSDRIRGDKADNLENAIAAYTLALEVRTRTDFPVDWAMTQNNLGLAYGDRIRGDKAENLEYAIAAFSAALEVYTLRAFPQNYVETTYNISIAYRQSGKLISAYIFLETVINNLEIISYSDQLYLIYSSIIEVCLELNEHTLAIEYLEFSKNRNLLENIRKKVELDIEKEKLELIKKDRSVEKQDINLANLKNLRKQREYLTKTSIGLIPINFQEIQSLISEETAIIEWYIFEDCFRAFIITRNNTKPAIWTSSKEDLEKLKKWIDQYIETYVETKDSWRFSLGDQLTKLENILHLQEIISQIPSKYQKLIIIPHRYLHIVPFHAVPLSANQEYLFDRFPGGVSYAPSCQLLKFAQTQVANNSSILNQNFSNLFAIQNPSNDLKFTNIEVETIVAKFQPQQTLKHQQATKSALLAQPIKNTFLNSQWLHFSCHGYFKFDQPLKSGLQLADAMVASDHVNINSSRYLRVNDQTTLDLTQCLTLEEIFELNLSKCHLVCLSACETGLTDVLNTSDEYISLSSGFIKAGASNIVSSLWAVSDFHTALLMIKFYEILENDIHDVVLSLNNAQKWLNQATQQQIVEWISTQNHMEEQAKQEILKLLNTQYKPQQKPFRKPEYWAAFYAISPV